jgi:hypothetical protein
LSHRELERWFASARKKDKMMLHVEPRQDPGLDKGYKALSAGTLHARNIMSTGDVNAIIRWFFGLSELSAMILYSYVSELEQKTRG